MKKEAVTFGLGIIKGKEYEVQSYSDRFLLVLIDGKYVLRHRSVFEPDFVDYNK